VRFRPALGVFTAILAIAGAGSAVGATKGRATIVRDDLSNTYQRLPRARCGAPPKRHQVHVVGATRTVGSPRPGTLEDRGTISGPPFGSGSVSLLATFAGSAITGTFQIHSPRGSVFGTVAMDFTITGSEIAFRGTARFTGGTGAYRGIKGHLKAHDHNTLDGQSGRFTLDGVAFY
jgi:hypothetical protein